MERERRRAEEEFERKRQEQAGISDLRGLGLGFRGLPIVVLFVGLTRFISFGIL